eukprot:symbB.v1.2.024718.t1/scaffold2362.1/size81346/1
MKAKTFDSWARPRLHVAATIAHGWSVNFYVSEGDLCKDSNTSLEVLSHTITSLKKSEYDLASATVTIQSDNTAREVKNGICMRWASAIVSDCVAKEVILSFLRTGHSHEDVDQAFGQAADWIRRRLPRAECSDDVVRSLNDFLTQMDRPHERQRQTKQWMHQRKYSDAFLFLPRHWAFAHLPLGIPAGLAMKNDIGDTLRDHIRKYTPYLRLPEFNLAKAADYLEHWVDGILPMTPLLDVSASSLCRSRSRESTWQDLFADTKSFDVLPNPLALRPADNYRKEAQIYRDQCVFQSAAKLWVEGVPWSDALKFSEEAERKDKSGKKVKAPVDPAESLAKLQYIHKVTRKVYSTDMKGAGLVRPWQCSWRGDFGISSMVDPEQAEVLMELYLQEGFLSDADLVGVEKVAATQIQEAFLEQPYTECRALDGAGSLCFDQCRARVYPEQAAEALAKQVAVATFAEISGMIERDLEILRQKLPGKREQAAESALDMKSGRAYAEEFMKSKCRLVPISDDMQAVAITESGRAYAEEFMKTKCRLVPISDDMQAVATTEFLQFLEPMRGIAGTVLEVWKQATLFPYQLELNKSMELDQQGLGLELIAMHGGHPVFPADVIMGKFRAGSPEQEGVKELQTKFEELYPPRNTSRSRPAATVQGANRATGHCDFSIENGEVPLDVTRILDVECVPIAEVPASSQRLLVSRKGLSVVVSCHVASMLPEQYFAECVLHDLLPCNVRLGVCVGKNGKPTVVIDQAHNIWLLNSSDETMDVTAGELFGFGTGAYTTIVDCDEVLQNGIPWVLKKDLDLVVFNKEPTSLCGFMRKLAVEQGLADLEIEYHVSVPKERQKKVIQPKSKAVVTKEKAKSKPKAKPAAAKEEPEEEDADEEEEEPKTTKSREKKQRAKAKAKGKAKAKSSSKSQASTPKKRPAASGVEGRV